MKTMTSWMFAAILFCGMSLNAQAQDYYETKDEVAISFGAGTNTQIFNVFSELFGVMGSTLVSSMATGGQYVGYTTYDDESHIPAFSIEYFHHMNPWLSLGAIGCLNYSSSDMYCNWQDKNGNTTKEKVGHGKKCFATLMPAVKFDWLRKKNVGLYSKLALGATYMYEKEVQDNDKGEKDLHDESDVLFNFQATFIGFEAGSQKVRGFAEFGVGEQGILSAGVRVKF